jgi:hypothetical protein
MKKKFQSEKNKMRVFCSRNQCIEIVDLQWKKKNKKVPDL